jgi:hypothetical protein
MGWRRDSQRLVNTSFLAIFAGSGRMRPPFRRSILRALAAAVPLLPLPSRAFAAVMITFYSHEFRIRFSARFHHLGGAGRPGGRKIHANYGFTATHVKPRHSAGSMRGEVLTRGSGKDTAYLAASDRAYEEAALLYRASDACQSRMAARARARMHSEPRERRPAHLTFW